MNAKEAREIIKFWSGPARAVNPNEVVFSLDYRDEIYAKGFLEATKAAEPLVFVITALTNRLGQAQHQIGKRTQILKEGTEEIECCLVPSYELDELLSCCAEIVDKYKKETLGEI